MEAVKSDVQFPQLEQAILKFWKESSIIEKGLKAHQGKTRYSFYDGPPFATGLPHYGHILAGTLKDIIPRFWNMRGYYVERRWGWDCHGLPVEFEMEKELGLSGLHEVQKYGIANFNESCRSIVQRYTQEWETIITRTGRWADFKNDYRTMDPSFMETVWWVVKQLWDKGLIYQGNRVMPYSWRISTPLSNFEASLNYKEVQDPSITIKLKDSESNRYFLAWTTTPWTLPANMALSVGPKIEYAEIEVENTRYVLAKERLPGYFKSETDYKLIQTFPGTSLEGKRYEPLFDYFKDKKKDGAFQILLGEHVTVSDGTGMVHTAPAHGEEDFQVCEKYKIPIVQLIDEEGKFTAEAPEYVGQNVKDADKNIIKDLKAKGLLYKQDTIVHNYPFCWRSDTPLINRAIPAWFVKIEPIKASMLKNNATTHWVPEHLRDGRFGNWLQNARDWNISRNRFWGTPIPIWRCDTCKHTQCIGSISELTQLSKETPKDIHKHFVDPITFPCSKCNATMKRIPEVLDCWFESGSMPYGQQHYPFENKEAFEQSFPADFIAEGLDQTRGWFYTLTVLSAALFDKPAFKNVVVNGLILAEDGKKMSKRLKNYPDPVYLLDTYGADSLRAYLMSSPASHAEELRFSENGVKEVVRSALIPYWNAYSFFVTYAKADGWEPSQSKEQTIYSEPIDQWLLSRLHTLIQNVESRMEAYHLYEVMPLILQFIDDLTNWYIRLNRRRFWSEEKSQSKQDAYNLLYSTLLNFSKVMAPMMPFVTENLFQNLKSSTDKTESIHLCAWPQFNKSLINTNLEKEMALIQTVVSVGRNLRNTHQLKTRQPLKEVLVITKNQNDKTAIEHFSELIRSELNVKSVNFTAEESKWVEYITKPNAKLLGPRLGKRMQEYLKELKTLPSSQVALLEEQGFIEFKGEKFTTQEVEVDRKPKQEGGVLQTVGRVTLWINTEITPELVQEGLAREFVNRVQKIRKDMDLQITQQIKIDYTAPESIDTAIKKFQKYIFDETLCTAFGPSPKDGVVTDIDGESLQIKVTPA